MGRGVACRLSADRDTFLARFGVALRAARDFEGLSQAALAAAAGTTSATIARYEQAQTSPRAHTVLRIALALDVPVELLLDPPEGRAAVFEAIAAATGREPRMRAEDPWRSHPPRARLGSALSLARHWARLSRSALARRTGFSESTILRYEQGRSGASGHALFVLSRALGVPPEYLQDPPATREAAEAILRRGAGPATDLMPETTLRVLVTLVRPWSPTRGALAEGIDLRGRHILFAGDRRELAAIAESLAAGVVVAADVPTWAVVADHAQATGVSAR